MILITTSIDNKSELDDDILLLGEWCRGNSILSKYPQLIKRTLSYHWEDREVFYKDVDTVIEIFEKLLPKYSKALNNLHNVNHSLAFWTIIIGPWLLFFIAVLIDRWSSISNAIEDRSFDYVALSIVTKEKIPPTDMQDYYQKSSEDKWNNYIFSEIIKNWTSLKHKELPLINEKNIGDSNTFRSRVKKLVYKLLNKLSVFSLDNKIIFIESYMSISNQWSLEKLLNQKRSSFYFYIDSNENHKVIDRSNLTIDYQPQNKLEDFIMSMIPAQMPKSYIENFDYLLLNAKNKKWPHSPKIIFTSNAHFANDQFKFWSAMHHENGTQLIVGQHGGGIGSMKAMLFEYLDKKISNKYITWGWEDVNFSNIVQLPALKLLETKQHKPKKGLLHVMDDNSRYSRTMQSTPLSSLHLNYLKDQYLFSNLVNHDLIKNYTVRNCPNNYSWENIENWNTNVTFDLNKHFLKSVYDHKLIVISNNSTTLLQVLAANIPTVIFWDPKFNEVRDVAQSDFDSLRNVGILYDSSELAANQVNSVWKNISAWWEADELQLARIKFCNRYARTSKNSLIEWKFFFENIYFG